MNTTLDVKYELGHSYSETWTKTDTFCPNCASRCVWVQAGGGDYYEGPGHLCVACDATFTMPRLERANGWQDEQRLESIRAVKS